MDYDLALHNTRVLNDGGSVPNPIQAESYIKYLKENNLWDSCVFFGLGGSKIDSNSYCSKLYDLKANADLLQGTGTAQPLYQTDGSLLYDGGDYLISQNLIAGNQIRETITKITIILWSKVQWSALKIIFSSELSNNTARKFSIRNANTSNRYDIILGSSAGGIQKSFKTPEVNRTEWHQLAFTFDNAVMDGSVIGLLSVYINGQEVACTKGTNLDLTTLNYGTFLSLGAGLNLSNYYIPNGSQTALHQIYNSTFTAEQILQNFNNIKPTDISEMYGSLTGAHINRVETSFGSIPMVDKVQSTIDKLKSVDLWNNCVFFTDAKLGVRKDSNQYVNAMYDLKNNADLLQATGTAQPKYDNGSLLYDGSDYLTSNLLNIDNKIRLIDKTVTVLTWVYFASGSVEQSIMDRWGLGNNHPTCLWLLEITATNRLGVVIDDGTKFVKQFTSSNPITVGWHRIGFTYDCDSMDGSVNGLLNLFIDNSVVPVTKTINLSNTSIRSTDRRLQISGINDSATIPIKNTNKTALHQIYNSILADEQLTWNFNNIRPEGV